MSAALELIESIQAAGGSIRADGGWLFVSPQPVAAHFLEQLRLQKPALLALLQEQHTTGPSSMEHQAPDAWADDVAAWAMERCISRDDRDDSGRIVALLADCAEWCEAKGAVPPTNEILIALLQNAGFCCAGGYVSGLVLTADFVAAFA